MAHGERAKKLASARSDYGGRRPGNQGWGNPRSRRAHAAAGGPSAKVTTHRKERRKGKRAADEFDEVLGPVAPLVPDDDNPLRMSYGVFEDPDCDPSPAREGA